MSQVGAAPGMFTGPLRNIAQLLRTDPRAAAVQAREFVREYPGQHEGLMLLIAGRRLMGQAESARNLFRTLAKAEPNLAALQYELGLLLSEFGDPEGAVAAFMHVTELEPLHTEAWRALGDCLSDLTRPDEAAMAYTRCLETWPVPEANA